MEVAKTNLTKIIRALKKSDKKFCTIEDLSFLVGIKTDRLKEILFEFYPLIYFDENLNAIDLLPVLLKAEKELNEKDASKANKPKKKYIRQKDLLPYKDLIDYIYQNFTVDGGILDTGYVLTKRDIKIISKLLKEEKLKLKNK